MMDVESLDREVSIKLGELEQWMASLKGLEHALRSHFEEFSGAPQELSVLRAKIRKHVRTEEE